ncbi:hypothetical protein PUNSTDRAFT_132652 [Punctularia strigosozonata HHB-11173 SS5]|uniref:uncharacterized protein n=1 Tax=Punctularia strigosozonata (strain HHB-11173) TaxID=741275 RepID=UPI0004417E51|nr:uncharacterized protein PUNSTDRAFT_132652 [Punctularia strigosozonata HHB-11173 SS5]EIN10565.1 hypothetical protein PUNSTDRAFT_132652 [Punctularia strigosozonata HHB-11173 SS5]
MNLARHSITPTKPVLILDARFDADCAIFTVSTPAGFAVYQSHPLRLLRTREITGGTLTTVLPCHTSSLLFLVGGGRSPRYPPNKVVFWDDALGKEVAELEFRERVRGLACRRGWLAVALRRRVVVFQLGASVSRYGEWDTSDNPRGLLTLATGAYATLLAIPGKQLGHVHLVHLPPCAPPTPVGPPSAPPPKPPPPLRGDPVPIIAAHTSALNTLTSSPSGRLLATTSERGTLVRVWDAHTGKLAREFRRGSDKAVIYGVAFRPDEAELCVWSDKGTVHVFALVSSGPGPSNRQSTFSPLTPFLPLPKYFDSEWSYAQYRIPAQSAHISLSAPGPRPSTEDVVDEERCVVGWIEAPREDERKGEFQLIVLTYSGGWYRLSLPKSGTSGSGAHNQQRHPTSPMSSSPPSVKNFPGVRSRARSSSGSSARGRDKGKEREHEGRDCTLQEFRRFGRWDGWG